MAGFDWGSLMQAGGAALGGWLGSKGSGGSKPPKWLRQDARSLAQFGQNLAQQPYTGYSGDRVAGFSPDTLAAFNMIKNSVGAATPMYQSAMNASQDLTQYVAPTYSASTWAGQDLSAYMNPYISDVIEKQAADYQNFYDQQYNNLASQAAGANAFGGSRFGVAQGQLSADALRNQALVSAQLRSQGFDTAAGLLSADVDRRNQASMQNQQAANVAAALRGQAAGQLGNLAGEYQGSLASDAQRLASAGSAQQALAQQQLDVGYGNWMDQYRQYPTQQLNWWSGALAPGAQLAGYSTASQGGGITGALGGAAIGANVGSSIYDWMRGWGGVSPGGTGSTGGVRGI